MTALVDGILAALAAVFAVFGSPEASSYNGYLEADYLYVAPQSPGRVVAISAVEGELVHAGQVLATLENTTQTAQLQAALAGVAVAQANLENLRTGSREEEIEVIRASLHRAEADQTLARSTLSRSTQLLAQRSVAQAQVDQDRAALQSADALVEQLTAQLRVAQLPARDAQLVSAQATLDMARAEADQARIALEDRVLLSPIAGKVEKVFFDVGEVAATGSPVLSIFPPDRLKAIFFVPEAMRPSVAIGAQLDLTCDNCPPGITARISRLASDPQYAPPILYSRDERARLVFRAEAVLSGATALLPGQPVTLRPVR